MCVDGGGRGFEHTLARKVVRDERGLEGARRGRRRGLRSDSHPPLPLQTRNGSPAASPSRLRRRMGVGGVVELVLLALSLE